MGSQHKAKSTRARRGHSSRSTPQPLPTSSDAGQLSKRPSNVGASRLGDQLPDLSAILFAFSDAQALVRVAHTAVAECDHYGPEEQVLRMGAAALDAVYSQLDGAASQLGRFRNKNIGTLGAAS